MLVVVIYCTGKKMKKKKEIKKQAYRIYIVNGISFLCHSETPERNLYVSINS
jgi:hypothetical protein